MVIESGSVDGGHPDTVTAREPRPDVYDTFSRVLGEMITVAADGAAVDSPHVVYRTSEIQAMRGIGPDAVRAVHGLKKTFGGRYDGPAPARGVAVTGDLFPRAAAGPARFAGSGATFCYSVPNTDLVSMRHGMPETRK